MAVDPSVSARRCAVCNAVVPASSKRCWLCGGNIVADESSATGPSPNAKIPFSPPAQEFAPGSFSLATLMLFVTLAAIVCGVISLAPGLGIALGLIMIPVLAHTAILAQNEREVGHLVSASGTIMMFLSSLVLVCISGIAAGVAFGVTCFAGGLTGLAAGSAVGGGYGAIGVGVIAGVGLGCVAGIYVEYRAMLALERSRGIKLSRRNKVILVVAITLAIAGALVACFWGSQF